VREAVNGGFTPVHRASHLFRRQRGTSGGKGSKQGARNWWGEGTTGLR